MRLVACTASIVILAATLLAPASAATLARIEAYSAVQVCQGALPSYDGLLRKRPLALQNEGATAAFVSCAVAGHGVGGVSPHTSMLQVNVANNGSAPVTVQCTALEFVLANGAGARVTKSMVVPVGGLEQGLRFESSAFPSGHWFGAAVSCLLPPQTGITSVWHGTRQEIGN